ncbi:protein tramtrack, beta isoform-like [Agrilus planipennis]|uniref:Protein tramtrack, beta isoform-like n=1 Tax=Agrilus planipennis TaxID=224129 RepID=A0A1W4X349_AGRPL|nr:protein tramtrack, beta isoform-like [Agrilus planipennis]XP_018330552.1 protein tramtrack, beta isoform-like [Agrilus planipennis]XP_018330553.1 protein tramtrack, beta isoform-like [Agrilus planipennis]XP_018330554.1 protein tramtrack, beta isoform-like [Agrilus planipennis]XP_018330555.1 protein tramtrack, beta isoform-like [Agrilus planipennis]
MVTPPQQFCVRWNSYQSNLQNAFPKLLTAEHFVDVTLACENEMLKCHKVVLSACSTYFEKLLLDNPCQHPIIFMKDMKFHEMQSLVDFMYKGEVNVTQDDLPSLLKSAEALQIRGLCGSDQLLNQHHLGALKAQMNAASSNGEKCPTPKSSDQQSPVKVPCKKDEKTQNENQMENSESSPACSESNEQNPIKDENDHNNDTGEDDSYFEGDSEIMDTEFLEEDSSLNNSDVKNSDFAIANVSCQYDGSPDARSPSDLGMYPGVPNRRIRRSDEELRRAAECITRGQTFQTVSDQFNIPISTIRFYMARKGILPRRKRGRACGGSLMSGAGVGGTTVSPMGGGATALAYNAPGNTSPIGPPYHIVHYKLPALGVSKLK